MKTHTRKEGLTFGQFVASVYDGCGRRSPTGIVRLAVNAQLIKFAGSRPLVIVGRIRRKTHDSANALLATLQRPAEALAS